jgi:polysaccharide biosynthesis/export protein
MPPPPVREYVIEEGEVLDIRVYNEERLSARTRVRADGKIALTLLGEVEARGKTPSALSRELSQRLQKYLQAPVVVVGVEDVRPLTVTVVGEVTNPGVFTLGKNSGVLQALASAGGFTDFADQDSIFVLRKQPMMRVKFTYRALSHNDVKAVGFALLDGDVVTVE